MNFHNPYLDLFLFADKKSTPECSPSSSPAFLRTKKSSCTSKLEGLAPIAKTEEMSDDLSEETLVEADNVISSTPIKKSSWRLQNGNLVHEKAASGNEEIFWSDEDDDEKTDRNASNCINGNQKISTDSVEDEFESFSCTDEEDEGDQTSLDSNSTSR